MRIYARKLNRRSLRVASVMSETIIPRSLRLPSRLNSSPSFATSFLSFQLFPSIRYFHFFPFVSTLPSGSFTFSFRFTRCSSRYVLPFVSTRTSRSFTYSFCNSSISIHFVCYFFLLVFTLAFHSLLLPFCFNSSLPFATSFLSFVSSLPFHSLLPLFVSALPSRSFTSSFVSSHS